MLGLTFCVLMRATLLHALSARAFHCMAHAHRTSHEAKADSEDTRSFGQRCQPRNCPQVNLLATVFANGPAAPA